MAAANEPNSKNTTSTKETNPSRKRRFFLPWRSKSKAKPVKNTTNDSPIHTPNKKQDPTAKQPATTTTITDEDNQEDNPPLQSISPKATDSTPPTPSRRRHFWNMKKTPRLHPSPLSTSTTTTRAAATELQATPTPVAKKGLSAAEMKQAMSAFTVPEQKTELEVNASLAQSPGRGAALGSHPPSLHGEAPLVPPVVGGEKGRPGLGHGKGKSERRGNRSTELVG